MQSVSSQGVYNALQIDYTSNLMVAGNSFTAPYDGLLVVCGIWVRSSTATDYSKTQYINVYVNGNLVIASDYSGSDNVVRATSVMGSLLLKKGDVVTTKYADNTYYDQGAWRFYKRER